LHYEGEAQDTTRVGGCVSLIGIAFVLMFLFGTISMYTAFNNVKSNTYSTGFNVTLTNNCSWANNTCLQLNGTSYMPMAYLTYEETGTYNSSILTP
jgi:hypothetical protein